MLALGFNRKQEAMPRRLALLLFLAVLATAVGLGRKQAMWLFQRVQLQSHLLKVLLLRCRAGRGGGADVLGL